MPNVLLEMKNIVKTFPGVRALDNVNLIVEEGEIHSLVGENGAGKSTLMNILSGVYPYESYEGEIILNNDICKFNGIKDSEQKGIVIIHQELALIPELTIGENMFLGNEIGTPYRINWDETYITADKFLKIVGLNESSRVKVDNIGVGKQQLVEIAKALAKKVKLLILDEPTASLNETDSKKLLDLILSLKKDGITSIIISHKLNEISEIADKITIIRDGTTIETLTKGIDDFSEARIVKGMVGRDLTDRFPKRENDIGEIIFELKEWNVYHPNQAQRKVCDNINFNIRKGEIVGISGLMGAGRTELAMSIFGKSYGSNISGKAYMHGKEIELKNVKAAINNKLAYITEDRKGNGLVLDMTIRENTTICKMDKISQNGVINKDNEVLCANEYKEKLRVKCSSIEQKIGNLSGGNQQKVLIGKWIFADPDILIMDEPTRGIDIGAKYEIYCIMNQLVASGKSIIMISSEMPEILGMCDRLYVMNEGRIVAEMDKKEATQETIMSSILKSAKGVSKNV